MTPESITTGVKKYKWQIGGGATAAAVATGIMLFFWNIDVSKADLSDLPETNRRVEILWAESPKVAAELRQATKRIDSLILVLGFTNTLLEKVTNKLDKLEEKQ